MALSSITLSNGTTSDVFTPQKGGDGTYAQFAATTVGSTFLGHPTANVRQSFNKAGTVRRVHLDVNVPVEVTDADTGVVSVPNIIRAQQEFILPVDLTEAQLGVCVSYAQSLIGLAAVVSLLKSDLRVGLLV
jgi:hypothetical protein